MQLARLFMIMLMNMLLISVYACKNNSRGDEHGGESEGEESGPRLAINGTYDAVRNGVRLILAYEGTSSSFSGTVENVTKETVYSVRVEVHLSNGIELGPTSSSDLVPGAKASVNLSAEGQSFDWWKAHAEMSEGEGGHEGEHGTEGEHREGGEG